MKINYYNYQQAAAICSAYQHLTGQPFDRAMPEAGNIREVIVAPYSRILQWQFVQAYLKGTAYETALGSNPSDRYDVILLPELKYQTGQTYPVKCIRNYLKEQGLPFDPASYHGRLVK